MKRVKHIVIFLFFVSINSCTDQPINNNNNLDPNNDHIDRSLGLFPHALGNYWVKDDFKDCAGDIRMDIVSSFETDTADFFEIRHLLGPCGTSTNKYKTRWYAEDLEGRIYTVGNGFKYLSLYTDMGLNIGDRFIRMGLMDHVIEKTKNRVVTEYDNYEEFKTSTTVFEKGFGLNPESWSSMKISNVTYVRGVDY